MVSLLLLLISFSTQATSSEFVLVRDELAPAHADGETVLGWRRVPATAVDGSQRAVPDVRLELLEGSNPEPFGGDQWGLQMVGAPDIWQESTGSGVVIAIVDSGVDLDHPDLADRIFTNRGEVAGNGVDDDGNGLIDDVHGWDLIDGDNDPTDPSQGHGTEVAGVAAASLNGVGIAGVAPSATILPIRACTSSCSLFNVAWAITYATDVGADVINLSLGGLATDPGPLADAVDYAHQHGVLVVAAAGNTGSDIDRSGFVPAGLTNPNLAAVAATDRQDRLWGDSNFGKSSVDLAAPGVEVVSSTLDSLGGWRTGTGTSYAAPHVSAAAALLWEVNPSLAPEDVIDLLGRTGDARPALAATTIHGTRLRLDRAVVRAHLIDIDGIYENDIVWLALAGVTRGCNPPTNDRYCPDDPVTRGQMAAFLHRILDLPHGPDAFDDDNDSIFQTHINALAAADITRGCNPPANNHYCPDQPVTRGEMAALLHRSMR